MWCFGSRVFGFEKCATGLGFIFGVLIFGLLQTWRLASQSLIGPDSIGVQSRTNKFEEASQSMNPSMNKITPFLWFDNNAEAAADFYLSIFPSGRKLDELRANEAGPGPKGSLLVVSLELEGQQVTFLNGGPSHKLSDAFSF